MTNNLKELEIWFVTGSQHLYGAEALRKVAVNAQHSQRVMLAWELAEFDRARFSGFDLPEDQPARKDHCHSGRDESFFRRVQNTFLSYF